MSSDKPTATVRPADPDFPEWHKLDKNTRRCYVRRLVKEDGKPSLSLKERRKIEDFIIYLLTSGEIEAEETYIGGGKLEIWPLHVSEVDSDFIDDFFNRMVSPDDLTSKVEMED